MAQGTLGLVDGVHWAKPLVDRKVMATPPRMITPNRPVFLTLRSTCRQFRFLPTKQITDSIRYIFWHCVEAYGIKVHEVNWMSNHAHICLLDERGVLPAFTCKMNSMISKQLNALRRQRGSNIEKGYSDITVLDDWTMASFCAYTLANPCAADLVVRAKAWKGFSSYRLEYGKTFTVERPNCGMWKDERQVSQQAEIPRTFGSTLRAKAGVDPSRNAVSTRSGKSSKLPGSVEGVLTRPRILPHLNDVELRTLIRSETTRREQMAIDRRTKFKKGVLGMRGVLAKKWKDCPLSSERLFGEIPRIATRSVEKAVLYSKLISRFNQRYEDERLNFIHIGKEKAVFPYGTWKMRVEMLAKTEKDPPFGLVC